jgi:hypothetical protein
VIPLNLKSNLKDGASRPGAAALAASLSHPLSPRQPVNQPYPRPPASELAQWAGPRPGHPVTEHDLS